jgi:adenylate cyclase
MASLFFPWEWLDNSSETALPEPRWGRRTVVEFLVDDYQLDVNRRELRRDAELIAIEPQVFDLLIYLVRNRDRVVNKDELIGSIWRGRIVSESTIAGYIYAARKAIGDDGAAQRLIRTLPRKGFRFIGAVEEVDKEAVANDIRDHPKAPLRVDTDKPLIAVLAFVNLSGDPQQEYLADSIAEDIITALSRYPSLFVIARNSSFAYKSRSVDVRQMGHELGARYLLEGSVRALGNRTRITAQLIEAATGKHIWAECYDRKLADRLSSQDKISNAITIRAASVIAAAERRRALRTARRDLDAWGTYQTGLWHLYSTSITPRENIFAQQYFRQAIDIDPLFAGGYKGLAWACAQAAGVHATHTPAELYQSVEELARKAVALDSDDAEAYSTLSEALLWRRGDYEEALIEAERAVALSPNLPYTHLTLASTLIFGGRLQRGLAAVRTALRIDPYDPLLAHRLNLLAVGLYFAGRYSAAAETAKRAVLSNPEFPNSYRWLAASLGRLGKISVAEEALQRAIVIAPASFELYAYQQVPWHRPEDYAHMLQGLREAGWKG